MSTKGNTMSVYTFSANMLGQWDQVTVLARNDLDALKAAQASAAARNMPPQVTTLRLISVKS